MPENDLYRLLYVSSARQKMSPPELEALLALSRAKNQERGITGALLYADGNFMQLLEGPRTQVQETLERIEKSSLHSGIIVLLHAPAAERQFQQWSMAYSQATWSQLTEVKEACRNSSDSAVMILKGFATDTSRFRLGG